MQWLGGNSKCSHIYYTRCIKSVMIFLFASKFVETVGNILFLLTLDRFHTTSFIALRWSRAGCHTEREARNECTTMVILTDSIDRFYTRNFVLTLFVFTECSDSSFSSRRFLHTVELVRRTTHVGGNNEHTNNACHAPGAVKSSMPCSRGQCAGSAIVWRLWTRQGSCIKTQQWLCSRIWANV